jgi:hypothetical protein
MSDTPTTTTATETKKTTLPPLPALNVARNNVTIPFVSTAIVRGDDAGKLYLSPNITKDNMADYLAWKGTESILSILQADANRRSQGCYAEALEDDGTFNEEQFVKMVSSDSARGFTMAQIDEQISELSNQQQEMLNALELSGQMTQYDGVSIPVELVPLKDLSKKITALKQDKAAKKRKTKEEKATEAAAAAK